jgi:hypothetical protein
VSQLLLRPKKSRFNEAAFLRNEDDLLDLGFFVFNMLTDFWIEFHDRHFFRSRTLVFGSRVEVTRTGGRFQLDFVAARFRHDGSLYSAS